MKILRYRILVFTVTLDSWFFQLLILWIFPTTKTLLLWTSNLSPYQITVYYYFLSWISFIILVFLIRNDEDKVCPECQKTPSSEMFSEEIVKLCKDSVIFCWYTVGYCCKIINALLMHISSFNCNVIFVESCRNCSRVTFLILRSYCFICYIWY